MASHILGFERSEHPTRRELAVGLEDPLRCRAQRGLDCRRSAQRPCGTTWSSTTVRLKMTYAGLPDGAESWTAIATVLHDGKRLAVGSSMVGPDAAGEELTTVEGTDDPSGPWVIRIDEMVGFGPQDQIRLAGPWLVSFVAP